MKYDWNETFQAGKEKESEVLDKLRARYKKEEGRDVKVWLREAPADGTRVETLAELRKGDIEDELGFIWEVKFDRRWNETGNVFIEHLAINHSAANYYVFVLQGGKTLVTTKEYLLKIVADNSYRKVHGGNFLPGGKPNIGTLLPVSLLTENSFEL